MGVDPISYPTLDAEYNDTEARSLKKINDLLSSINDSIVALTKPGVGQVGITEYVYGLSYNVPLGTDLLDVSCYNPTATECWVFMMVTPSGAQPGMPPSFPIHVYPHNPAYYEAMTDSLSIPAGQEFSIAVSSNENVLVWNPSPIYMAIRHT